MTVGHGCGYSSRAFNAAVMAYFGHDGDELSDRCRTYEDEVRNKLDAVLAPGDVLAVATATYKFFGKKSRDGFAYDDYLRDLNFDVAFLEERAAFAAARNASFVVLSDGPLLEAHGQTCLKTGRPCLVDPASAPRGRNASDAALAGVPGALFFDPMPAFCNATACTPWIAGGAMGYWDYDHVTLEGALHVAPALAAFLREAGVIDAAACPGKNV